jgi:flagellar biosynthetic protein FliQ
MDSQTAIELGREALMLALLVGAPMIIAGLLVGLVVGLVQALTQMQEQTVVFVPKLVVMVLVLVLCMPWLIDQVVQYTHDLFTRIPETL